MSEKHTDSILYESGDHTPRSYLSGNTQGLECHHCINGTAYRKKSEKYGLWVWLTHDEHEQVHHDRMLRLMLKRHAQMCFERKYGHEQWMEEFHKDYNAC